MHLPSALTHFCEEVFREWTAFGRRDRKGRQTISFTIGHPTEGEKQQNGFFFRQSPRNPTDLSNDLGIAFTAIDQEQYDGDQTEYHLSREIQSNGEREEIWLKAVYARQEKLKEFPVPEKEVIDLLNYLYQAQPE